MSELSMHELEAELGEVLPEREALSAIASAGGATPPRSPTSPT